MRDFGLHLIDRDAASRRQGRQPGNRAVQITEVSRPTRGIAHRERQELLARFLAESHGRPRPAPELLQLVIEVRRNILPANREPGKAERPQIDPREEIVTEAALPYRVAQVAVCAGDQLKVTRDLRVAPQGQKALLLER